jgi:aminopeptidase N
MRLTPALVRLVALTALAVTSMATAAEAPYAFGSTPGKLPKDVIPLEYTVNLIPDLASKTFRGTESVSIKVLRPTSKIMLNQLNLEIDSAKLSGKGMAELNLVPMLDKEQQTLTFNLPTPIKAGEYVLAINYRGLINREAHGMFFDNYRTAKGEKTLIGTQMEPTDARRMVPSWDEPSFRARYKFSAELPANFKAYSNMPVSKDEPLANEMHRVTFGLTPKMPSYLMVLVAGEMERTASVHDGVEIGLVTTEGKQDTTAYAMQASKDLLTYFNNYFGIRYPLPKLDQIATPGGFGGAMENWGGIIYNENTLLFDAKKSPDSTKQRAFGIIAHEMAHQWFGNLVTMAWWDNLWLNEGFASWMGTKASDKFNPDWRVKLGQNGAREMAMSLDARKNAHAIQRKIDNEAQASGAFDGITYQKGQMFLNMLEAYLGEETFREGIRAYMQKHQYSNTTTVDLWSALGKASGKPVAKIASDWTSQAGFPIIKVDAVCEAGKRKITLEQEQFLLDDKTPSARLWSIPLQIGTVGGKAEYVLLSKRSTTITQPDCNGTLVVDPDAAGYFRVQYSGPLFAALGEKLASLPDTTRAKLIADTWAQVITDRLPLASYLDLLAKAGNEPRLAVWNMLLGDLAAMEAFTLGESIRPRYEQFVIKTLRPKLQELGMDEKATDTVEERQLRTRLSGMLVQVGDEVVLADGRARYQRFLTDASSVPPSQLGLVLGIAGREANQATYEKFGALASTSIRGEDKFRYFGALSAAKDPALAKQTMQLALATHLPPLVTNNVLSSVSRAGHMDLAWAFAKENKDAILKGMDAMTMSRSFFPIVSASSNAAMADELLSFAKANLPADTMVEANRIAAAIRTRAEIKAKLMPQLDKALK